VCFILVLSARRGTVKGAAFIAGWVLSLTVMVLGTLALTGGHPPRTATAPRTGVSVAVVALGVALVAFSIRLYRRQRAGPPKAKEPPKWMAKLDTMPLWGATGLGILLQPWPFVAAGAASVIDVDASTSAVLPLVAFGLLATSSYLVLEGYVIAANDVARERLGRLRMWLEGHRSQIFMVLAFVIGVALVVKGVAALAE
jgi:hypothetical protein